MSIAEANELAEILERVRPWPERLKITLARRVLESVETERSTPPMRMSVDQVFGLLKTDAPPPTDEQCERILEEELMKKYGS